MRRTVLLLMLLLLLVPAVPVQGCDAAQSPDFRLEMVCPSSPEGFAVRNIHYTELDLAGYSVTDGEGSLTFAEGVSVPRGQRLNVFSEQPEEWMGIDSCLLYDSPCIISEGRFGLSDSGDDLYLVDPEGNVIDSFVYGDAEGYSHWEGEPYHRLPKKTVAYRNAGCDMPFDGEEWKDHVPGRTLYHFPRTYDGCRVTPVLFPDSEGDPIISCLQDAEESVRISMYTFDSKRAASVLLSLLDSGVEVRMFMEASPAGGMPSEEIAVLKSLSMHGADIRLIKSDDGYKRFDYVHAKYAVIDGDTCAVTSENWTDYAFTSNRGWGAVVENRECAEYLSEVFDSDMEGADMNRFDEMFPTAVPAIIPKHVPVTEEFAAYDASVTTVLSPDYSRETLMSFLDSASERIYSQQLNVQYSWLTEEGSPLRMLEDKTAEGLDVKLMVDVTYDSPYDSDLKDGYAVQSYYSYRGTMDVRYTDGSRLYHNKGIVADDRTWIGSMNWTDGSLDENRELCLIIDCREFTDMYAKTFLSDWGPIYSGTPFLDVDVSGGGYGRPTVLDACGSSLPFGSEIRWDLDGDGEYDMKGSKVEWRFYRDADCRMSVMTPEGEQMDLDFGVHVDSETKMSELVDNDVNSTEESAGFTDSPLKYVPLIASIAIIIALKRLIRNR